MAVSITEGDLDSLAVIAFYILLDKANVSFPGSTRSHPSSFVFVQKRSDFEMPSEHKGLFPQKVLGNVWEEGVYPVLIDPENQSNLTLRSLNEEVSRLKEALRNQFILIGLIPGTLVVASEEDVVVTETEDEDVDEDLKWPEGHLKLIYPVVD